MKERIWKEIKKEAFLCWRENQRRRASGKWDGRDNPYSVYLLLPAWVEPDTV